MGIQKRGLVVALDFDGTCVTHEYPKVGRDIGARPVLNELIENGHQLILWTMRSGKELQDAVDWFKDNDIPLYGVQSNPTQHTWTSSPKAYAQLYIDDAALGCPLAYRPGRENDRPFVNWYLVRQRLIHEKILPKT